MKRRAQVALLAGSLLGVSACVPGAPFTEPVRPAAETSSRLELAAKPLIAEPSMPSAAVPALKQPGAAPPASVAQSPSNPMPAPQPSVAAAPASDSATIPANAAPVASDPAPNAALPPPVPESVGATITPPAAKVTPRRVAPVVTAKNGLLPSAGKPVLNADGIFVPATLDPSKPAQVLVVLHGMGGSGARIGSRLGECAATNGWVLVAPTMAYRDYMDPEQVRLDDQAILPWLRQMLDTLPITVDDQPIQVSDRALFYGFSRGAQAAHRFALFYPERVASVVSLSAGSYTMPRHRIMVGDQEKPLAFPYGVGDLEKYVGRPFDPKALTRVPFFIGVGSKDNVTVGVPRPWDPYQGATRVDRAKAFSDAITAIGGNAALDVFNGAGHEETSLMRAEACEFLSTQTRVKQR